MKNPDSSPARPLLAVGRFVVDYHKVVDHYPWERSAARVTKEVVSNGGAALNVLVDLALLKAGFPLYGSGRIGRDLDGGFLLDLCGGLGIDTTQVLPVEGASTGYTDVYTVESTGRHTCFHFDGAGDALSRKDVKLRAVAPGTLFLGALGALGQLDEFDPEYGRSGAAQLVRDARKQNITTVVELSPVGRGARLDRYQETLTETDYLIVNDRVTEELADLELYSENRFDPGLVRRAGQKLLDCGLRKGAVIQSGAGVAFVGADGGFEYHPGFFLPWDKRAGSAGVDHAFAAGLLEGLHRGRPIERCLRQGLAASTACRRDLTTSGGLTNLPACLEFCEALQRVVA